ncbi:MAG: endolytic transglycosylase MltG [Thermoanaerobaculia bacterium]
MSAARRLARLVLLLGLLAISLTVFLFRRIEHPARPAGSAQTVTVFFSPGTPTARIFRRLAEEGVVRSGFQAEAYYRIFRSATPLEAGEYRFDRPTPIDEIVDRMGRGDVVRHTIVVPEGLVANETFELFWSRGIGNPQAFRRALKDTELLPGLARGAPDLEGFLFPETYVVTRSTFARRIVAQMLAEFRKNFTPELRERAHALGLTPVQAVTLASIVEKESDLPQEGPLIASVYWNRLRRGMRLQADPTVIYALKRDGRWTGTLYRSDYNYPSPYNTYLVDGFPPGPICNPSLRALKAALSPARSDYLYFVADATGGHAFSRTFEEHLHAISAARRLEKRSQALAQTDGGSSQN